MLRWALAGALLVLLLLVLVVTAPARLLPALLPGGQVALQGVSGTLWHGTASRCVVATPAGPLQLGRVEWRLRPLSLFLLSPAIAFDSEWGEQHASGVATIHGSRDIALRDVDARVDASLLRQLAPIAVEGRFALLAKRLRLREGLPVLASGRLVWEQGAWNAPRGRLPLGTYAVDFEQPDADSPLVGDVLTLNGPVQSVGTVSLRGRQYAIDVRISSEQGLDQSLARALSLMAQPEGDAFHLTLNSAF